MLSGIHSSLSALSAFAKKQESIADNTANVNTDGFKKTRVTFKADAAGAVQPRVSTIDTPGPLTYEQTATGYELVERSNVEVSEEIPEAMLNSRSYQANLKMVRIADDMLGNLLDIKS
ncbi:MAG: flagellar biosynthesis protein FlgC [Deltaproteobacteria bacterium]|nr:flagellar biosynthesis protein FlgC [Deltaproteobacteria bacterium]